MDEKRVAAILSVPAQFGRPEMTFELNTGVTIVGKRDCDVSLKHDFVSSTHAHIEISEDGTEHWVEDLESTNGTFFGSSVQALRPLRFYQLTDGRQLRFGRVLAEYSIIPSHASTASGDLQDRTAVLPIASPSHPLSAHPSPAQVQVPAGSDSEVEVNVEEGGMIPDSLSVGGRVQPEVALDDSQTFPSIVRQLQTANDAEDDDDIVSLAVAGDQMEDQIGSIPASIAGDVSGDVSLGDIWPKSRSRTSSRAGTPTVLDLKKVAAVLEESQELKQELKSQKMEEEEVKQVAGKRGRKVAAKKAKQQKPQVVASVEQGEKQEPEVAATVKSVSGGGRKGKVSVAAEAKEDEVENVPQKLTKAAASAKRKSANDKEESETTTAATTAKSKRKKGAAGEAVTTLLSEPISVVFTGVADSTALTKKLKPFGVKVLTDWTNCTHLVTDKIRRTTKFLCSLSRGKSIISIDWIKECIKAKCIIDPSKYELHDPESEEKWKFSLSESLQIVRNCGPASLFQKYKFFITPSVEPAYADLQEMIEAGGGSVICNLPPKVDENVLIIGCRNDKDLIHVYQNCGWKEQIYETEFILCSALTQKLDFTKRYAGGGGGKRSSTIG